MVGIPPKFRNGPRKSLLRIPSPSTSAPGRFVPGPPRKPPAEAALGGGGSAPEHARGTLLKRRALLFPLCRSCSRRSLAWKPAAERGFCWSSRRIRYNELRGQRRAQEQCKHLRTEGGRGEGGPREASISEGGKGSLRVLCLKRLKRWKVQLEEALKENVEAHSQLKARLCLSHPAAAGCIWP